MFLIKVLTEPAILTIIFLFIVFITMIIREYGRVKANLALILEFLKTLNKNEISYKFQQMDSVLSANVFSNTAWEDFKKALIFPEKLYLASQANKNLSEAKSDVYLTIDSSYFFNEENLVIANVNYKFIQAIPTILTGLGPLFTFLKMAIAFTAVNFSAVENVGASLDSLISSIQIAALCSVFAVGCSLLFIIVEKNMYQRMCKQYYLAIQEEFIRLFDIVTSERFLIDILKEAKMQNGSNVKLLKTLPEDFANAITKVLSENTTPYLENILYSLNKLNETLVGKNSGDVVDKLF